MTALTGAPYKTQLNWAETTSCCFSPNPSQILLLIFPAPSLCLYKTLQATKCRLVAGGTVWAAHNLLLLSPFPRSRVVSTLLWGGRAFVEKQPHAGERVLTHWANVLESRWVLLARGRTFARLKLCLLWVATTWVATRSVCGSNYPELCCTCSKEFQLSLSLERSTQ